ncbi:hypothetical protein ES703_84864 [subsurface metagenome]
MEPESHCIATIGMNILKNFFKAVEIGESRADITSKINPCEVRTVEKEFLIVEVDTRLRKCIRDAQKYEYKSDEACEFFHDYPTMYIVRATRAICR